MSNVPTGITAYRNPETGEIAGSYQPNKVMAHLTADGVNRLGDTIYELRMEVERWKKAAEANIEENVQLRLLISDMEAARDAALRLKVERQPELGRIADALFEYNERDQIYFNPSEKRINTEVTYQIRCLSEIKNLL